MPRTDSALSRKVMLTEWRALQRHHLLCERTFRSEVRSALSAGRWTCGRSQCHLHTTGANRRFAPLIGVEAFTKNYVPSLVTLLLLAAAGRALFAAAPDLMKNHDPAHAARAVTDARGRQVSIPLPFNGSVIYAGVVLPNYLLVTRDPTSIVDFPSFFRLGGLQDQLLGRVFPSFAGQRGGLVFNSGNGNIETMLREHPSALFTWYFLAEQFEAFGLPAVGVRNTQQESEIIDCVRLYAQAYGDPDRAEQLIRAAHARKAALAHELGTLSDAQKPRILALYLSAEGKIGGAYSARFVVNVFWSRGGAQSAMTSDRDTVRVDPERILQLDPDVILLEGPAAMSPANFARQPQWSTLRAVKTHRVYRQPPGLDGFMWNIIDNSLYSRWVAELLHPERVRSALRAEMKATYLDALGYAASEADIDGALAMHDNAESAGYERFRAGPSGSDGAS